MSHLLPIVASLMSKRRSLTKKKRRNVLEKKSCVSLSYYKESINLF